MLRMRLDQGPLPSLAQVEDAVRVKLVDNDLLLAEYPFASINNISRVANEAQIVHLRPACATQQLSDIAKDCSSDLHLLCDKKM